MSAEICLAVFLLGGTGALARYAVLVAGSHAFGPFPLGIVAVNALAAFAGSVLASSGASPSILIAAGGGFVGSLGTLSSLCTEFISLYEKAKYRQMVLFAVLTLATGVLMTWLGFLAGEFLRAQSALA